MQTSELYEEYRSELQTALSQLQALDPSQSTQQSNPDPKQYEKLLKQCETCLKQMAIEMHSLHPEKSRTQQREIEPMKRTYIKKRKEWEAISESLLLTGRNQEGSPRENVAEQNQKLYQSKKLLYQMEDLSAQISGNLFEQSGKLQGATSKVRQVNQVLAYSNGVLDRMIGRENRRANAVKIVLVIIAAVMLAIWLLK